VRTSVDLGALWRSPVNSVSFCVRYYAVQVGDSQPPVAHLGWSC
jgi:hypothetical protein